MKIRVFVSGIRIGLEEARRCVMDAIGGPLFEAGSMELFGSRPEDPLSVSLKEVERAHVLVSILSDRYGAIPSGESKSFSQLEYEHALTLGRPILAYLYRAEKPDPKQSEFIARVKTTQTVRPQITDTDHLAKCVVADLQFLVSETFANRSSTNRVKSGDAHGESGLS